MNLENLNERIKKCEVCDLAKTRTIAVPGEGDPQADIMFIGEAPGKNEDLQGRPFVGSAGKFLDELLDGIGLKRKDVYIGNIVKCRPSNNRDPLLEEIQVCWLWLEKQIKIIQPKIIVPLGRHSLSRFIPEAQIGQCHGKVLHKRHESLGEVVIFPSYHPAAALYKGSLRLVLREDFEKIPKVVELLKKEKG